MRCMSVWIRATCVVAALCLVSNLRPALADDTSAGTIFAVGDIADCTTDDTNLVSADTLDSEEREEHGLSGLELLPSSSLAVEELIEDQGGIVVALGDLAYPAGTAEDFKDCFDKVWGRLSARTYPVPGNHEYKTAGALPYKQYLLEKRGIAKTFYSFDYGGWHLMALDSEIDASAQSEQMQWLRRDLAAITGKCALAFFHKPAVTSLVRKHNEHALELYEAVSAAGVSIVLNGHNHFYERSVVLDGLTPAPTPTGTRNFTIGTGGQVRQDDALEPGPLSAKIIEAAPGVLKLDLKQHSYEWKFIAVEGHAVLDSGTAPCQPASKVKS